MDADPNGQDDERWMMLAIRLARRGHGQVAPNPSVGCILVRDGRIVARGGTRPGGRPHAEAVALERAGAAARGATAYVSLEPCAHHGRTPPCADALIRAGVARVVTGATDPDPRVGGRGHARLRQAGIAVTTDVCRAQAEDAIADFALRLRCGRPAVTLKLATSLDSRIATSAGESRWITGSAARRAVHFLRARHDAIMTGSGTVRADDPALTCRLPGLSARSPVRVVLDSGPGLPLDSVLVATANDISTVIITAGTAGTAAIAAYEARGIEVVRVAASDAGQVSPPAALAALADRQINSVLIEAGGRLAASFLAGGLVDRLVWFRAPMLIGDDGAAAPAALGVRQLAAAARLTRLAAVPVGEDMMETYGPPA